MFTRQDFSHVSIVNLTLYVKHSIYFDNLCKTTQSEKIKITFTYIFLILQLKSVLAYI